MQNNTYEVLSAKEPASRERVIQRGTKVLVIGITQRKGDQQFINSKGEDLFQKSWEAGHKQWETSEPRAVLQLINVNDTNLYSFAYNSVFKFYLLHSINTRTLLTINTCLSRGTRFVYSRKSDKWDEIEFTYVSSLTVSSFPLFFCQCLLKIFQASDLLK